MATLTASSSAPSGAATTDAQALPPSRGYWALALQRFTRDPIAMGAAAVVLLLIGLALLGPWLAPADPYAASMLKRLKPIGTEGLPLGSDELGRDMLSRLMVGARLSLFIGITPVVCAFMVGSVIGIVAGYAGGMTNTIIMRTVDVFYAFPSVLLAIALSGVLGAGIVNSLISLTIVFIPQIVRVHVLGNVLGPIFVYATSLIAVSMILASGLSFLGLGVKPPEPEWGLMLNTLRTAIYVQPWVAALPGLMIFITSISFNILSDGLRSAMDNKG